MKEKVMFTPSTVSTLEADEVFVFGSNIHGRHSGGAAQFAKLHFGAIEGQGEGLQGQSYAIPTSHRTLDQVKTSVDNFIDFASNHGDLTFYVTEIGCKNAGFKVTDIAPLFIEAYYYDNVILPKSFVAVLYRIENEKHRDYRPNWKYTFKTEIDGEEYTFAITDPVNMKVIAEEYPKFGALPKTVEYDGDTYEVCGLGSPYGRKMADVWPLPYVSNDTNFLDTGALFDVYSAITRFEIPKNLEYYGYAPFPHCEIVSNSDRFEIIDGMVIDKKYDRVVQCIDQWKEEVVVPEGIKEIYGAAFYGCRVKHVTLPDSLLRIGVDAFWMCRYLENVVLPKNLEYFDDYSFCNCSSLKTVTLKGWKVKSGEFPFNRAYVEKLLVPAGHSNEVKKNINSSVINDIEEY